MSVSLQTYAPETSHVAVDQADVGRARANALLGEQLLGRTPSGRVDSVRARALRQDPREHDWDAYVERLPALGVPLDAARGVSTVWNKLRYAAPGLPVPAAAPTAEDGVQLVWDRGRHHLELDVDANGTFEWFYLDRDTDMTNSGDGIAVRAPVPEDLRAYLAAFFATL